MKPPVNLPQTMIGHVGVHLGGADAGVAQQLLDHPQVRAMFQQVRGETVPQHVGRDIAGHTRPSHPPFDAQPQGPRRQRACRGA